MDSLDRRLLWILERNARITYRELSEKLNISIPSIQKRIIFMEESGRISKYSANISLQALGASMVLVQGTSKAKFAPEKVDELGKNDSILTAMCGSQNHMIIGVFLRKLSDLDGIVSFIKDVGVIPHPEVLMITSDSNVTCTRKVNSAHKLHSTDLTNLDHRIIWALHDNARKSVLDISKYVGVSAKTVSRRLARLLDEGLIDLNVLAFPNLDEEIIACVFVYLKPSAPRKGIIEKVRQISGDFIDEDLCFSNAPNQIMFSLNTQTIRELCTLLSQIRNIVGVDSVIHEIIIHQKYFETWRDRQLFEMVGHPLPKTTHNCVSDTSQVNRDSLE